MKKLLFTLAICLFSMNVFAFVEDSNEIKQPILGVETVQNTQEILSLNCTIEVTYIITIDHGTWIEIITIVVIEPCPIGH